MTLTFQQVTFLFSIYDLDGDGSLNLSEVVIAVLVSGVGWFTEELHAVLQVLRCFENGMCRVLSICVMCFDSLDSCAVFHGWRHH